MNGRASAEPLAHVARTARTARTAQVDGSLEGSEMMASLNTTTMMDAACPDCSLLIHNGDISYARCACMCACMAVTLRTRNPILNWRRGSGVPTHPYPHPHPPWTCMPLRHVAGA